MGERLDEQTTEKRGKQRHFRDRCLLLFIGMLVASAIAIRMPVMTLPIRLVFAGTIVFGLFTGVLYLIAYLSARPKSFFPIVFFLALLATWAVLGDKPPDAQMLRSSYIRQLRSFVGTRYVRGGETKKGVDCSGLARAALAEAMIKQGVTQVNPRLLGPVEWKFWWRDMTAKDMGEGKYGYTVVVGYAPKLAGYDASGLQPGDMAIADSVHMLIYCGNGEWIQASPDDKKVVINKAPADSRRGWFNTPVTFVRWWILEETD